MRILSLLILLCGSVAQADTPHHKPMPKAPTVVVTVPAPQTVVVAPTAAPVVTVAPSCPGGCCKPAVRVRVGFFRVFVR